ncbi:unnamed protein product [Cyclocybe aegerita]|uniref:FAD/NAD(P)-binding domain-containing protein n=1 Tax=Cyclocybe aegerita TaxID=1973307 RepID=A0A8S0VZE4_CYCAE|nr:unnamed protein product [Cyclocybe aegerita]
MLSEKSNRYLTVVVVGGGSGGVDVVLGLSSKLNRAFHRLILVTARPRYLFFPAALRLLANENAPISSMYMPFDNIFGTFPGEVKVGTVTSIEENKDAAAQRGGFVVLDSGEKVIYDVLVVCTGSSFDGHLAFPNDEEGFKEHVTKWRAKIKESNDIVIVGGGAVGIELSGEIKDFHPMKNVTIVQANPLLLSDLYPNRYRIDLEKRLRRRGINMIFDEAVGNSGEHHPTLKLRSGTEIPCDLLIPARGGRPSTTPLKFMRPPVLTDRGYVKVAPTLQVDGHSNIFALGDIIDWPEAKQLMKIIYGHSEVVVANVMRVLEGKAANRVYKGSTEMLVITNGQHGGATYLGLCYGFTFGDFLTRLAKSKDVLVGKTRAKIGLPAKPCEKD